MLRHVGAADCGKPPRFLAQFLAFTTKIAFTALLACAAYTFYALSDVAVERTRISENALLPGLVDDAFADPSSVRNHVERLRNRAESRKKLMDYIYDELKNVHIEAYRQSFFAKPTIFYVFRHEEFEFDDKENSSLSSGENVYGIVRAPRSPPFESILVVVRVDKLHLASTAFVLALAAYAKQQIYWARDVIFLFVDGEELATEAWMSAFCDITHDYIYAEELEARGGPIIGAFVLDVIGNGVDKFRAVNIQYGMVNGRLPNLDLVNLFILLVEKYGVEPTLYNVAHGGARYDHFVALALFSRIVTAQSFEEVEGLHSILGGYGVNAITLQAAERAGELIRGEAAYGARSMPAGAALDTTTLARVAEGGMRSLNNVLEKLHQSYFLYFLTHTHWFVSVAYYMPIIGLMLLPMLFFALSDWLLMKYGEKVLDTDANTKTTMNASSESFDEETDGSSYALLHAFFGVVATHLISFFYYAFLVALFGLNMRRLAEFTLTRLSTPADAADVRAWLSGVSNVAALALLLPIFVVSPAALFIGRIRNAFHYNFVRFFTACEIVLLFGALSLLNFPLAFSLCFLVVPFAIFVLRCNHQSSPFIKVFGFGIFNPISVAIAISTILERNGIATFGGITLLNFEADTIQTICTHLMRWMALTARNHFLHNSALLPLLVIVCLTIFNTLLQILFYEGNRSNEDQLVQNSKSKLQIINLNKEK